MSTTADDVRRAVLRDGIKGRDEEIARYQARAERAEADAATLRDALQKLTTEHARLCGWWCAETESDCTCGRGVDAEIVTAALTAGGQG